MDRIGKLASAFACLAAFAAASAGATTIDPANCD